MSLQKIKEITFVVGLYKSGTSIITELVEDMGFMSFGDLWLDSVQGVDNKYLTRESESVNKLNDKIFDMYFAKLHRLPPLFCYGIGSSIIMKNKRLIKYINETIVSQEKTKLVIKDPRFCLTLPIWLSSLSNKCAIRILFVVRDRNKIIKSWRKDKWCKRFLKIKTSKQAYYRSKQYEKYLIKQYIDFLPDFECHMIDFEKLKKEKYIQIQSLMNFLGYQGDIEKLAAKLKS
jgi:hypothetical protein